MRILSGAADVAPVYPDGRTGLFRDGGDSARVVVVAVGQQYGLAAEVVVLEIVHDGVALVAGVDDRAAEGGLVGDDVAVGLKLTDRDGLNKHISKLLRVKYYRDGAVVL